MNIHQKLQEKKQKQLAELKIIEEEIKQGKLGGPNANLQLSTDDIYNSLARQPIPRTKKHAEPICWPPPSPDMGDLDEYAKNVENFQQSLEMNANINGNLNKLSNYKQNLGDLSNINANLNNLGGLNNLSAYGIISGNINNLTTRMSPSQNLNSLGMYTQNINTLDSIGSAHSRSPNQNIGELGELGGLSPIMSSDNGSVPRQIVPKSKKRVYDRREESNSPRNVGQVNMYNENNLAFRAIQNVYQSREDARQIQSQNVSPRLFCPTPPFPYQMVPPPRTKQNVPLPRTQVNRSKTPEILLAPHYLDKTRVYYDWGDRHYYQHDDENSTLQRRNEPNSVSDNENVVDSQCEQMQDEHNLNIYKSYRIPSDIDSQISLPRSYTLPREFKYYRRGRTRKQIRNDHFVASTNSSDGKVFSFKMNEMIEFFFY